MTRRSTLLVAISLVLILGILTTSLAHTLNARPASSHDFDTLIINGRVLDGTGSPWYYGEVGIRDGHIVAIGRDLHVDAHAKHTIDAHNHIIAPGFIDMLGQSEETILVDPRVPSKIFQGITTEVTGEGNSIAPLNDRIIASDKLGYEHYQITPDWRTFREYFARLKKQGMGINLATYIGATQVRRYVIGDADRAPTPDELTQMKDQVRQAMQQGAMGVSTSLEYAPAPYAKTEELIALASVASEYGGIYATHMRSEGDGIMDSLAETARIGREAKIPVEIWHLKTAGKPNWGRMPQVVEFIDKARSSGLDITADTYAYTAWSNEMSAFIPPWAHDGGLQKMVERLRDPANRERIKKEMDETTSTWDNEWNEVPGPEGIMIAAVQNPKLLDLQGKTIAQIATEWHKDPKDTLFDILIQDNGYTYVSVFGMKQEDVSLALKQPWVSIDNDSEGTSPEGILGKEHPHPRAYGTFPRILAKYVREEKLLTLPDAIRKFSALPAQRMGFTDRGVLKIRMRADIVVFDPETIHDVATFDKPNQFSVGMDYVLVNGTAVVADGKMTGALPGEVILGPGYADPR